MSSHRSLYHRLWILPLCLAIVCVTAFLSCSQSKAIFLPTNRAEIDYVNVQTGLYDVGSGVEEQPIVQLPNSLLRIKPLRESYRATVLHGFSLFSPQETDKSPIVLFPHAELLQQDTLHNYIEYDEEVLTPYSYQVYLDEYDTQVDFTLSHFSGLYSINYSRSQKEDAPYRSLLLVTDTLYSMKPDGGNGIIGQARVLEDHPTTVYFYIESDGELTGYEQISNIHLRDGLPGYQTAHAHRFTYKNDGRNINIRYAISLISPEQAKENLRSEIQTYQYTVNKKAARNDWQNVLRKIEVEGGSEADRTKFYTALYRSYLWPTRITEGTHYYAIHEDTVRSAPHNRDIFVMDHSQFSYETTHPLQLLLSPDLELQLLATHIEILRQTQGKVHTSTNLFTPMEYGGSSFLLQIFLDAQAKGVLDLDSKGAYEAIKNYTLSEQVHPTNYDLWCLGRWAALQGLTEDAKRFFKMSQAKEQEGVLRAEDVEHLLEYNDGTTYPAAINYVNKTNRLLSDSYVTPDITPDFFAYLFSYTMAGRPRQAQKNVRTIIDRYFTDSYLGVPGEDRYGSLSSSLVFAMMGLYPVAPGFNAYIIGAPVFSKIRVDMGGGRYFTILAPGASSSNKYVTGSILNEKPLHRFWFKHSDIAQGGKISLTLSDK